MTVTGCSSVLSDLPKEVGALPAGVPDRTEAAPAYPRVHDMPPQRDTRVLTPEERKKLEADLAAARDRR